MKESKITLNGEYTKLEYIFINKDNIRKLFR